MPETGFVIFGFCEEGCMKRARLIAAAAILALCFMLGGVEAKASFYYPPDTDGELVVVIDPGHGGTNLGADYNGFSEKEMNMIVANAMYEELSKYDDITVYLTHTSSEDSMTIQSRADFAASVNADFLFCLHFNMSPENKLFGSEVWVSAFGEENRQGYRFGMIQMETMRSMGLFLRGVKTRLNDQGSDYYGILRFCEEYGIASALVEHCHIDHDTDVPFCDEEADLIAFGKADATSAARFFGLKSEALGVDYSQETHADLLSPGMLYAGSDTSDPDICTIEQAYIDREHNRVGISVTGCDYDSPMLYYAYSIDGGETFTPYLPWPDTDLISGYSPDTFTFEAEIPDGVSPFFVVRAVNQYDRYKDSNLLTGFPVFTVTADDALKDDTVDVPDNALVEDVSENNGGAGFRAPEQKDVKRDRTFGDFLLICLVIVSVLFFTLLITNIIQAGKRRKKRKRNRKR